MSCPYLIEAKNLKKCAVFNGMMVISIGEIRDYCETEGSYKNCEFFTEIKSNDRRNYADIKKSDAT